ncbi:DUF185-domain-containing protein [Wolfiporia cocos MD-104 SS10]|uniref:Protein arginine methyltransferase NDUFAF7 n=1 Tax=Wolfiporia cocos (strain MD-104) TaxID=742152 RepID=A0A2H3JW33_WOLCO|nr:DUF185-domain-containing protein [Wolfiporia cocos MD-104 SS10]
MSVAAPSSQDADIARPTLTPIEKILLDDIKAAGPISFARYMQMCLSHLTEGYYMKDTHSVFGARGDFITSPEISQVFGELVAIWLLSQWLATGGARPIRLVELGPGRGTLMQDILRVLAHFPASRAAVQEVHLVETSPAMQRRQEERLGPTVHAHGWTLRWHCALEDVPRDATRFTMIVAHEFFDALPFHLLQRTEQGWQEVMVAAAPNPTTAPGTTPSNISKTRFRQVLSPSPTPMSTVLGASSPRFKILPTGARIEVSPAAHKVARRIGELVRHADGEGSTATGCALIVDYGADKAFGSSFRAFKDHQIVDVFHRPGECDLTANVDFAYLREAATEHALSLGPITQAAFLLRQGLQARVDALKRAASSADRQREIEAAAGRLADLAGMGSQYKVMGMIALRNQKPRAEEAWPFVDVDEGAVGREKQKHDR